MGALILARLGMERGLAENAVLAGSGLTLAAMEAPDSEVSAEAETAVISNLASTAGPGATWGLDAGCRYHLTTFGIWGFALMSAPTVRAAVDIGLRFIDLTYALTAPYADLDGADLRMTFRTPALPDDVACFILQRDMAAVHTIQTEVLGRGARFRRVTFTQEPASPEAAARFTEVFGVTPEFGAAANTVVFDPGLVDQRLPQADERTTALAQAQCRALLDRRNAHAGLAGQVRDLILARLRDVPSAGEVATALNLSERTLRRRLSEEDTSVRTLVDEVRATLAAEFLASGSLTVAEIADRLGYAEMSSFSQAFRRWHGVSARQFVAARTP
ncbi:AraC family transcriptional regulator [Nocardioides antri]|uniref:AraC family transcriptional regulator n=2 Tax=Nocardioides antri TaxID=2607659 RepID=A0A5B1M0C3_9ACTN|nr:AraC family transcriptional regulator [Nocardioides antri]